MPLFLRALAAFLILPGVVAGLIPWLLAAPNLRRGQVWRPGLIVIGIGLVILLWCVRDFYVAGKGTLAPWDPPKHLVQVGLYQYTRNPMYLGVLTIVTGWALLARSRSLIAYLIVVAVMFHARVVFFEEPWLAQTFGEEWPRYKARIPRWMF